MHAFDRTLTVRGYREYTGKITAPVRLALVSDLHSTLYGENQGQLCAAIYACRPQLVLMAGDIADHRVPHGGTRLLLSRIARDFPCFYVSGNHEQRTGRLEALKAMFAFYGVTVLSGTAQCVAAGGQRLQVCGVDDPHVFAPQRFTRKPPEGWRAQFHACRRALDQSRYSILLSHRPELTDWYRDSGFDLVVAGHAHGGQVRIPGLMNGLLAPHQGLFPRYAGGRYALGSTTMIVSRGLCLNRLPRIYNPPELVVIDLEPAEKLQTRRLI